MRVPRHRGLKAGRAPAVPPLRRLQVGGRLCMRDVPPCGGPARREPLSALRTETLADRTCIPPGNAKACIFARMGAPPASSWKEAAVLSAEKPIQMSVLRITLSGSRTQRPQWTLQTLQRRIRSGKFSLSPMESDFDEHQLFDQEELAVSDLSDPPDQSLYQTPEWWMKRFQIRLESFL